MKRWIAVLVLALIAATAFGIDLSAGIVVDYQPLSMSASLDPVKQILRFHELGFGAFFDATYVLLSGEYVFGIADPVGIIKVDGEKDEAASDAFTASMEGVRLTFLNFTLLGKYPFQFGKITVAPALGLSYLLNLTMTQDGDDIKADLSDGDQKSLNDFYLLGGVLVSYDLTDRFFIQFNGLFGFDLTPEFVPDEMGMPGLDYSGWKLKLGLSAGYKISSR